MACSLTLSGRDLPCRDAVGGVAKVWILYRTQTAGPFSGKFVEGMYLAVSSGEIAGVDATAISGSTAFYYDFNGPKNTSTFTQTVNSSAENGNVFYSQVLSLVLSKPVSEDVIELRNLTRGRLSIIVEDNNGNKFVMGHTQGVEATGGSLATGTAKGDLNGYTLEFTSEEAIPAPLLGSAETAMQFDVTP
jgi:hypothetical protein